MGMLSHLGVHLCLILFLLCWRSFSATTSSNGTSTAGTTTSSSRVAASTSVLNSTTTRSTTRSAATTSSNGYDYARERKGIAALIAVVAICILAWILYLVVVKVFFKPKEEQEESGAGRLEPSASQKKFEVIEMEPVHRF